MSTSTNTSTASGGGITFLSLLGLTFIVLKLVGVIGWSWWLVTLPLWGGAAIVVVLALVALAVFLVVTLAGGRRR